MKCALAGEMPKRPVDRIDTRPTGMLGKELQYLIIKAAGEAFWHDKQPLCGAILIIAPIEYFYWHDKASIVPARAYDRRAARTANPKGAGQPVPAAMCRVRPLTAP